MAWFLPSILAAALAVLAHFSLRLVGRGGSSGSASDGGSGAGERTEGQTGRVEQTPSAPSPYFAIGDLHGDVRCARHWVGRTGLIDNFSPDSDDDRPDEWSWNDGAGSSLVFAGDYVDKGPTSRQTVEFVRLLTTRFPGRVTAILGNHELELLRDRDAASAGSRWGGGGFHQLAYASAHPAEYLNYLEEADETDELVVELLYNASAEVYGLGHHRVAQMAPPPPSDRDRDAASYYETYGRIPITEYMDPRHRALVSEKLEAYQRAYLDAYRSGTTLGRWVEERPVAHLAHDGTLFVHGGVSGAAASLLAGLAAASPSSSSSSGGAGEEAGSSSSSAVADVRAGVDRLNDLFRAHAHESNLTSFLDSTPAGRTIEELVTYRGNHPHPRYGGDDACVELSSALGAMGGPVRRIAVGHTPDASVRTACGGTLLAVDSMLGRWIRAAGNDYCPGGGGAVGGGSSAAAGAPAPAPPPPRSRNRAYVCPEVGERCEGQIVRFDAGGEVTLIH